MWKYRTLQWHETTYKIRESTWSSPTGVQYNLSWLLRWRCSNDSPNPPKPLATYLSPPCFLSLWCPVAAHAKLLGIRWTNTTASRIYRCPIWRMGSMKRSCTPNPFSTEHCVWNSLDLCVENSHCAIL
jgi:hypothetical protein